VYKKAKGGSTAVGDVAVTKLTCTGNGVTEMGCLLFLTAFYLPQLCRESGNHLLLGEQTELLKKRVAQVAQVGTFSTGDEHSDQSATVPVHMYVEVHIICVRCIYTCFVYIYIVHLQKM